MPRGLVKSLRSVALLHSWMVAPAFARYSKYLCASDAPRSTSSLWLSKVVEDGDSSRAGAQPATAPRFAFISSGAASLGRCEDPL
uniref:Secreted protein n=1 Tax=Brassica campestris TaxID=3711 RepID=M4FB71_BRACM